MNALCITFEYFFHQTCIQEIPEIDYRQRRKTDVELFNATVIDLMDNIEPGQHIDPR